MANDPTEMPNSRVLLQQHAIARAHEAANLLNTELANAARLGLLAQINVHTKKRDTHKTADGTMDDISVSTGDAEYKAVEIVFASPHPPASVMAMRRA